MTSQEDSASEAKKLNRRKVLGALGASTAGIAGFGVGSASASSGPAEIEVTSPSEEKVREIVKSNATGVLETLYDQGVIDHAHPSELELEPLALGEEVSYSGSTNLSHTSDTVSSSSYSEEDVSENVLMITKKMNNGELCLFIPRDTKDAYASFFTGDKLTMYDEVSSEAVSTSSCYVNCMPLKGCGKTWLDPTDQREMHYKMRDGRCLPAYNKCCDSELP